MLTACPPRPAIAFSASGRRLSAESAEEQPRPQGKRQHHAVTFLATGRRCSLPFPCSLAGLPGLPCCPRLARAYPPACSSLDARLRLFIGRARTRAPALNGPCPRWAARAPSTRLGPGVKAGSLSAPLSAPLSLRAEPPLARSLRSRAASWGDNASDLFRAASTG